MGILQTIKSTEKRNRYHEKNDFRLLDHKAFFITDVIGEKEIKELATRKLGVDPNSLVKEDYPKTYKEKIDDLKCGETDLTLDTIKQPEWLNGPKISMSDASLEVPEAASVSKALTWEQKL